MERIPLIRPYVNFEDLEINFREIVETGKLTKGDYVSEFSAAIRQYTGAKYCYLTTSATTSLFMALHVLELARATKLSFLTFLSRQPQMLLSKLALNPYLQMLISILST